MKLLVLGGSGLVGNSLLKMNENKFEIITTFNQNKIKIPKISAFQCSLPQDFTKLEEVIKKENPEVIVNAMGYSNLDFCELNKEKTHLIHVKISEKISRITEKTNTKIIFLSSDYVFDGLKGNYKETDNPNSINYYGQTKIEAEKNILKNKNNVVLRTSVIYDWSERVRFFNYVIDNLKNQKRIKVTNDVFNSITLIDNLIKSIFTVIEKDAKGIFHVVDSTCASRLDFAKCISKIFNFDEKLIQEISINDTNVIAKRPKNACLDNSKAKKELGVKFGTLEDGVRCILTKSKMIKK
jgi:dTDP-4-dehydrorhamnose reductase